MAVLTDEQRQAVRVRFVRDRRQGPTLSKAELRAAVDATDAWIESNQASFNAALPEPFKTAADATEKTFMFCYVAMKRAGVI